MILRMTLWAGVVLVRLLAGSYRFRVHPAAAGPLPDCYILGIWHQNLFAGILAQTGRPHCVMVSRSRDGEPVSLLCVGLGHIVLRGSSRRGSTDKGGKEAKEQMIEALSAGLPGAITVDGPKGPAHEVKPGIIEIARRSGAPIVPYLARPNRFWTFQSWDAFRLPKPFTRVCVSYGAPIHVPADIEFSGFPTYQRALAEALIKLEAAATGALPPLIPAPGPA